MAKQDAPLLSSKSAFLVDEDYSVTETGDNGTLVTNTFNSDIALAKTYVRVDDNSYVKGYQTVYATVNTDVVHLLLNGYPRSITQLSNNQAAVVVQYWS